MSETFEVVLKPIGNDELEVLVIAFTSSKSRIDLQRAIAARFYGRTRIDVEIAATETGRGRKKRVTLQPCQRLTDLYQELDAALKPLIHFRSQAFFLPEIVSRDGRRFKPGDTTCLAVGEFRVRYESLLRPSVLVQWELE